MNDDEDQNENESYVNDVVGEFDPKPKSMITEFYSFMMGPD